MSLREYLRSVADSQSIEELWEAHVAKMAEFGFDRLLYGFTRYRTSTSLGDPGDFIILTNHSRAYTDVFLDEGHYFHAPMVHWALENEGAKVQPRHGGDSGLFDQFQVNLCTLQRGDCADGACGYGPDRY